jgi:Ras-related protein Rab-1A
MSKCYILKVGIIGSFNIGKTSFLNTYIEQESVNSQLSTIGVDYRHKIYNCSDKDYKLHIWDTAGQEQFSSIVRSYLRQLDVMILMYDITDKKSFQDLDKRIEEVDFVNKDKEVIKYIVGNKKDLESKRLVTFREAKKYCNQQNIQFSETTIKDISSINLVFDKIMEEVDKKLMEKKINLKLFYNLEVDLPEIPCDKSKCCNIL